MSRDKIYESREMYLETILRLKQHKNEVHSVDIVDELNFSKSSVSRGVNILKNTGYIIIHDTGAIDFTPKGYDLAHTILERHQVMSKALMGLGVDKEIAEKDACRIEHVISDETFYAVKSHLSRAKVFGKSLEQEDDEKN